MRCAHCHEEACTCSAGISEPLADIEGKKALDWVLEKISNSCINPDLRRSVTNGENRITGINNGKDQRADQDFT